MIQLETDAELFASCFLCCISVEGPLSHVSGQFHSPVKWLAVIPIHDSPAPVAPWHALVVTSPWLPMLLIFFLTTDFFFFFSLLALSSFKKYDFFMTEARPFGNLLSALSIL